MQRVLTNGSTLLLCPSWIVTAHRRSSLLAVQLGREHGASRALTTINFGEIDKKWQTRWAEAQQEKKHNGREKAYVLAMFPYPSGALHMGHVRVYTIADVLARFRRMQGHSTGKEVIYPMGWDAFGLPAENAAIERGLDPAEWTKSNIDRMKEQLQGMNTDMDWSRELITCSPDFYKHTQRIFLLLHEHGLAYQAESLVNYDPIDRTVLANEQVDSNGFSWRSGAKVEKLNLKQWFLKITDYKEQLLRDLRLLKKWPERVVAMQQNWLGRSQGTKLSFDISTSDGMIIEPISVFTTRLDTLLGVQFLALSIGHPLIARCAKSNPKLQAFVDAVPKLPENSKTGFLLDELWATNPLSKVSNVPTAAQAPIPIWVAPYVKSDYGEGAVMGVPAHDERDFAFWRTNCSEHSIRPIIASNTASIDSTGVPQQVFTSTGVLLKTCEQYSGLTSQQADEQIYKDLREVEVPVERQETWRLRDWLISRQRYWGTPIPIIHCKACGPVPVPVEELPVELPELDPETFRRRKGNPLETAEDWVNVACPKCEAPARRDTDTMDTFVDSSWYMFRFADPHNVEQPFGVEKSNKHMPVDIYVGGIEHAILHLLYARFISKFLADIGMWSAGRAPNIRGEPFKQLISQGMVHGKTFNDPATGRFLKPEELDLSNPSQPIITATRQAPNISFEKMSKSKYNGVDPSDFIYRYGADVTRVHMLFQAPVSEVLEWEEARIAGVQRWLVRLYKYIESARATLDELHDLKNMDNAGATDSIELSSLSQEDISIYLKFERIVTSITTALADTHALNTCISDLMTLTNDLTSIKQSLPPALLRYATNTIVKLVSPFAPAFAEECWQLLHETSSHPHTSIFEQHWPEARHLAELEEWAAKNIKKPCAIMENGKLRMVLDFEPMPEIQNEEEKLAWALKQLRRHEKGKDWLDMKSSTGGWKKVIVVKGGQTINFVGKSRK